MTDILGHQLLPSSLSRVHCHLTYWCNSSVVVARIDQVYNIIMNHVITPEKGERCSRGKTETETTGRHR